jgi:hypothetical protein
MVERCRDEEETARHIHGRDVFDRAFVIQTFPYLVMFRKKFMTLEQS